MRHDAYSYALALFKEGGVSLGTVPIEPDWAPAFECARFSAIRRGSLAWTDLDLVCRAVPIWDDKIGKPFVKSFAVQSVNGGGEPLGEFPFSYFSGQAHLASALFIEKGELEQGEKYLYLVSAVPKPEPAKPRRGLRFQAKGAGGIAAPDRADMNALVAGSSRFDEERFDREDFPVFVPQRVVDEAAELTREAGVNETGGILIGHLRQDPESPEMFAQITAQIPAPHTESDLTKLTFTKETWSAVQEEVDRRQANEIWLGWWHSHSYLKEFCKECDEEKRKACNVDALFFSTDDVAVQRSAFSRAYHVALVISDAPCTGLKWALFGWRRGKMSRREFRLLGAEARASALVSNP